jgi:hypothetical protein
MSTQKRYDGAGKPIGRTRIRLARTLTTGFWAQLGMEVEIDPAELHVGDGWDGVRWYATFWREMPWGGYLAVVYAESTMGACVERGVTVSDRAGAPFGQDAYTASAGDPAFGATA